MATKIHKHGISCMDYPVGYNLTKNLRFLNRLSVEFNKFYGGATKIPLLCVRGSSGIFVGGFIALEYFKATNRDIIVNVLRKSNNHHGGGDFERIIRSQIKEGNPIAIVDDFIGSGNTMRSIYDAIKESVDGEEDLPSEPIIDSIFVTGSSFVDPDEEIQGIKLNHLFIE